MGKFFAQDEQAMRALASEFAEANGIVLRRPLVFRCLACALAAVPFGVRTKRSNDQWIAAAAVLARSQFNPLFWLLVAELVLAIVKWLIERKLASHEISELRVYNLAVSAREYLGIDQGEPVLVSIDDGDDFWWASDLLTIYIDQTLLILFASCVVAAATATLIELALFLSPF